MKRNTALGRKLIHRDSQDDAVRAAKPQSGSATAAIDAGESQEQEGDHPDNNTTVPATQTHPQPLVTAAAAAMTAQTAPAAAQTAQPVAGSVAAPPPLPTPDAKGYYRKDQVAAHEHAHNFYHRGKGQWLAGLPPAGSAPQTGVRGPGKYTYLTYESTTY